ncbi:MAG: SNF2 helicase associated domain-containing protein [Candidatus Melainabacteria bacterium]|nr:SNF2 helicase associated domain-containing protein [Candidatus Melainabacteria bacterium]
MKPSSNNRQVLSLQAIQEASSEPVYRRGVQYYRRKKVLKYEENATGSTVQALVIGSEPQPYKVELVVASEYDFTAECSCPYFEPICKHSVAVVLTHIAKSHPGIRFDLQDSEKKNGQPEKAPKARDFLDDPLEEGVVPEGRDFELGILVLEKPLALIVGVLPEEVQGKVNILKVPPQVLDSLEEGSKIWKLTRYLTSLPQTTKGQAGGHRIPRGDEGVVIGHLGLCARVINTSNGDEVSFSTKPLAPRAVLSETENGELLFRLEGLRDGQPVPDPVFFLGQSSWILSEGTFYPIDVSALHKLFPYFDSYGHMTIKLELVPKFLSELPVLRKRMAVQLDETNAPFPIAITEPPAVVISISEKGGAAVMNSENESAIEVCLGFKYGNLVLPSRDETSAVESEKYTRTISESGQSVWVKRLWEEESQVRLFLSNLQPERTVVDRFFFEGEPALETLFYLSGEQSSEWDISGWEKIKRYKVRKNPLSITARLTLKKDSYKFNCDLICTSEGEPVELEMVLPCLFKNRNFLQLPSGENVRIPSATLLGLLKAIGQGQDGSRPLYQALAVLHALDTHEIEVDCDEGFQEFIHKIHHFQELEAIAVPADFKGELRVYQKEGCNWLGFLREYGLAGILADDMGLGKTIQALALLLHHHGKSNGAEGKKAPSLVVAPTSVVYNWLSEAKKFTPSLSTALFLGRDRGELLVKLGKDKGKKPDVVFTTYGIIRRDYEQLKKIQFEYLILDEAQNIKNPESVGAVASKSLNAFHRLALSGTPVENRLKELWSLFDFLMPDFLSNYKEFYESYERPIEAGLDGAGQRLRKIVNPFILRRLKSQVEKELPDRTDIVHLCELDDEQRSIYLEVLDECRQQVFSQIASQGLRRSHMSVLKALLQLRQVCCDPRLLKGRDIAPNGPSAKLETLVHMVEEIVDEGHKILVFSQFVSMLTLVRKEFEKIGMVYEYIDGQTPAKDRLDKVNAFNADPNIPVFLISLKAGGTGLNLTGADYVIHYDPWWNPAVENQATDRAHRIGQTRHVFNYKLITRGTVEEKILGLQRKKKELAELVIGGDENVAKSLTQEDLEFLFSV